MSQVAKVIELVGVSEQGWEEAAQVAVNTAAKTLHGITGVEVTGMTAKVEGGKIVTYKTTVKIAFAVNV
jgi:flavin-binding protein dodecin